MSGSVDLTGIHSLGELARVASVCTACRLAETRTQVVFSDGSPEARLVVVGEAPGADEDRIGRPFVGRAGKLLDQLLLSVGFPRETVYICNVIKCRPPANRNPHPDEVRACSSYLRLQLDLVKPKAILAVGTFAVQTLLETTDPIGRLRGTVHEYHGVPLVPTYHPAALLRNPGWIRPAWEDAQRLRDILDT
ncbi:MAG: uracil-DNA glycosylase [Gemmatimonadota bacterium]|jgi:DNA polymerase|nr:uracil-DNA glycosylase [Gemmatimonadota bacterium]